MKAAEYFNQGYSCSESIIMEAIEKGLVPEEFLSAATSFSGGMGSGCLCGAVAGSQMVLGYVKGRKMSRAVAREFIQNFMATHKATCCRVLTRGMDMASPERKAHCTNMVDDCSKILEEMIKVKV